MLITDVVYGALRVLQLCLLPVTMLPVTNTIASLSILFF